MTDYPKPSLTADVVAVALDEQGDLRVLMIQRGRDPFRGSWALPGGFCEPGESVEESAARELEEETKLTGLRLEQLRTFSKPGRDPRGWVVSVAHIAAVPRDRREEAAAGDDAAVAKWLRFTPSPGGGFSLHDGASDVVSLAFDHDDILRAAVARLQRECEAFTVDLLPRGFSMDDASSALSRLLAVAISPGEAHQRLVAAGKR